MAVVVQKYGGSSVADLERIRRVAQRIAATVHRGDQVVAVCSAMGNTTNELLALARSVSADPSRRELDMLVSVGERIAMALLAMALQDLGVKARSLTGSQSGIVTDESHADAKVVEVRPTRLRQVLDAGEDENGYQFLAMEFFAGEDLEKVKQVVLDTLGSPLEADLPPEMGLYIHIPFCRKRCKFCYFRVYTDKNAAQIESYLDGVAREIDVNDAQADLDLPGNVNLGGPIRGLLDRAKSH